MTNTTKKALLITGVVTVAAVVTVFAMKKSKTGKKFLSKVGFGDTVSGSDDGSEVIKKGSANEQRVLQLQAAVNAIHEAAVYINAKCGGIKWQVFPGGKLAENGLFDDKTEQATKFYLARTEVDMDYLEMIRQKVSKYKAGDKCVYPLAQ